MGDDHAQRTLEQKALLNVRAQLDRKDPDAPVATLGQAASHAVRTLPLVLGAVGLVVAAVTAASAWYKRSQALPAPTTREEYADQVFRKAQMSANRRDARRVEGLRGQVQVSFRVMPTGYLQALEVSRSSHDAQVDRAATFLVKAAEPYGKFPAAAPGEPLALRGTWRFDGSAAAFTPDP